MALRLIVVLQIITHHSKSASVILTKSLAEMYKVIALIQKPCLVDGIIEELKGLWKTILHKTPDKNKSIHPDKRDGSNDSPQLGGDD